MICPAVLASVELDPARSCAAKMLQFTACVVLLLTCQVTAFVSNSLHAPSKHDCVQFVRATAEAVDDRGTALPEAMPGVQAYKLEDIDKAEGISRYSFEITADPKMTQNIYKTIEKDIRKKANFPGFRKGQIPPFAMGQVIAFSVEETVNECILKALGAHGLKKLEGAEGNADVTQKVDDLVKSFKPGSPLVFDAKVKAQLVERPEPEQSDFESSSSSGENSGATDTSAVDAESAVAPPSNVETSTDTQSEPATPADRPTSRSYSPF